MDELDVRSRSSSSIESSPRTNYRIGAAVRAPVRRERHGIIWYAFESLGQPGEVVAVVSTRHGGVSAGSLGSLNLSYAIGDDPERVRENRRRFAGAIGVEPSAVVCAAQVHGNRVASVDENSAGAGFDDRETAVPDVDGLVTDRPGLALWLGFADCVPILAYDPARPAVGIAHAGWRGTLAGVATELVSTMVRRFGTQPADLRVAIGPSIGPCCYTVGSDLVATFDRGCDASEDLFSIGADGRQRLDLWEANRRLLLRAGVAAERISSTDLCTACRASEFFSHRAQNGRAGRIAAVIALRNGG